ncbi:cytochrome C biogenesis protein [Novimethylophilus kurashikiensis]|uniref:Cytochrome C biogenesis protein n=1 Tax=Novimethylophilus kurashikiensis TaxID=1825523 RepID=A0A2R5F8V7_9PROT|nr:transporter [Novimethylophilus kurashikiensis]GBG14666.1 cytochrome C biogenesis protein [Novimethylophilus kurashikiensis]
MKKGLFSKVDSKAANTSPKGIASASLALVAGLCIGQAHAEESFFDNWLENVSKTQENQPHWMTPLVTVTPRLEQEYRFDYNHLDKPHGVMVDNYGAGKGLEIIPSENTEIIFGVPAYIDQSTSKAATTGTGWGDASLLFKYRLAAANEENGNYIVSAFLGASLPTGSDKYTNHHTIITPTIAAGKGWGDRNSGVDVQSTLGIALPTGNVAELGRLVVWNTALQGHVGKFWPEVEASYTHWYDGPHAGKNQLVVTYGATVGRFEIEKRMKAIVGIGYQTVQGTEDVTLNHGVVATVRVTF